MTEDEKKRLKEKQDKSGLRPEVKRCEGGTWVKNAVKTGDDIPAVGKDWTEFWQIFTMKDIPLNCPLCNAPLRENDTDGCHISVEVEGCPKSYSPKKYIIPGHHGCNLKSNGECQLHFDLSIVEAIKKQVQK